MCNKTFFFLKKLVLTDLLYFSEKRVGALDLPLTQLSKRHLLQVNLRGNK